MYYIINEIPLHFAEASNTIRVFVVVLPGLVIAKCGRYQLALSVSVCSIF